MERVKFLCVEIKVYPATIEHGCGGHRYDWDTVLVAKEPTLATDIVIGLPGFSSDELQSALEEWVDKELLKKGRELAYQNCPKAPEK